MEEIWKDIAGYEGLYQVSNLGRIKSLERLSTNNHITREKILVQDKDRYGYHHVRLYDRLHKSKSLTVHRLVAIGFIPNPNNLPQVNHINEDKTDNRACNLEWVNAKDNCNHGTRNKRISMPVKQYTKEGIFVREYTSIAEAEKMTGIKNGNICNCCQGKPKYLSAGGFVWKYAG